MAMRNPCGKCEACRKEEDGYAMEPAAVNATFTGDELAGIQPQSKLWTR